MKDIHSYVPEGVHFLRKRQSPSRLFFESCAVFSPERDFRILASRGNSLFVGENFFTLCGISQEGIKLWEKATPQSCHVLIPCKRGTVLLFADLFWQTGLLFGVLIPVDAKDAFHALCLIGQRDLLYPEAYEISSRSFQSGDEELCERMEELFYYTTRMFSPKPEASLWTQCLLIANFAGCRLEKVSLPVEAPSLSKRDEACMTLFLLCSFLTLRQKNGEVSAEGGERSAEGDFGVNYQCSVSFVETEEDFSVGNTSQNETLPLFLSDPCFSDLVATSVDGGMRLETRFPVLKKEGRLCSLGDEDWVCLEFCILGVLNSNV